MLVIQNIMEEHPEFKTPELVADIEEAAKDAIKVRI